MDQSPSVAQKNLPPRFRHVPYTHVSGSGQFSRGQLIYALNQANLNRLPVVVIDLRAEPHAFIDNQIPVGFKQSLPSGASKGYISEEKLIQSLGYQYIHIPVQDHFGPSDWEVQNFLNIYRKFSDNHWLHFHCHGGSGRTTTFLAMVDILKNAHKDSLKTILEREHALGGKDLYHIDSNRPNWYIDAAQKRLMFLKKFYSYVKTDNYQHHENWIDYTEKQKISGSNLR